MNSSLPVVCWRFDRIRRGESLKLPGTDLKVLIVSSPSATRIHCTRQVGTLNFVP